MMKRLKVALLGLQGVGTELLRAAQADDQFELVAIAEADSETLRREAEGLSVPLFADHRSAIVESVQLGLDAVLITLPPYQAVEFDVLAAERGIGVFQTVPWARNVLEARRVVEVFARCGVPLVLARPWQSEPATAGLRDPASLVGRVFAAEVSVRASPGPLGWRGDSVRAGAGVLLNDAYEQLDLLVCLFGLPQTVFGQARQAISPGAPRKYDTEDAMALTLVFSGDRVGSLMAWRGAGAPEWSITLVGQDGVIHLCRERMAVHRPDLLVPQVHSIRTSYRMAPALAAFGAAHQAGLRKRESMAAEHLSTIAVLEAAYLSAKTGAPESPRPFLP